MTKATPSLYLLDGKVGEGLRRHDKVEEYLISNWLEK